MTKFEEEFDEKVMPHKDNLDLMKVRKHFTGYRSGKEFETKENELKRLRKLNHLYKKAKDNAERMAADRGEALNQAQDDISSLNSQLVAREKQVKELIEADKAQGKEIVQLKSQLQQQALPVVPECVGKELYNVDFNYWIENKMTLACFTAFTLNWLEQHRGDWNIEYYICRLRFGGYTVEKPQLFRVCLLDGRHTLTRRDPRKTLPFNYTFLWSYSSELKEMREINKEVDLFTEQEIKSIDERYWQFAVPVEDGE